MEAHTLLAIASAFVSAVFAAGGAWMAVRVELKYLRRDVDALAKRVARIEHHAPFVSDRG